MVNVAFYEWLAPYWVDILNSLHNKLNFEVYLIYKNCLQQNFNNDELLEKVEFSPNYLQKPKKNIFRIKELICIIKKCNPEYIISPEFSLLTLQLIIIRFFLNKRFKIIVRTDDSFNMVHSNNDFTLIHKLARKILTPFVDNLILCDSQLKDWYNKKLNKGIFFPIIRDDEKLRKEYNNVIPISNLLNEKYSLINKKVILFVGRLVIIKNIGILIDAFKNLNDDSILVIVGEGEEERKLKDRISNFPNKVIFTGRLEGETLLAWYNIADIFVLPSIQEAFGAVTNEALIAGCYCLVSKNAGSSCLISEGVNGNVFNPYSTEELTLYLKQSLVNINKEPNIKLKKNIMQTSFNDYVKNLIKNIER